MISILTGGLITIAIVIIIYLGNDDFDNFIF